MNYSDKILEIEWEMFSSVNNLGGKASCQNDYNTFKVMRLSQILIWDELTQKSYYNDLLLAKADERNLLQEKYARMMFFTHKSEYAKIAEFLPKLTEDIFILVDEIAGRFKKDELIFREKFPKISGRGRRDDIGTSTDVYLKGELLTYSKNTLLCLRNHINSLYNENLVEKVQLNTVKFYGYESLEQAEQNQ